MTYPRSRRCSGFAGPTAYSKTEHRDRALLLALAVITAGATAMLTWLTSRSVPQAILTGGATFPAAWRFYNALARAHMTKDSDPAQLDPNDP